MSGQKTRATETEANSTSIVTHYRIQAIALKQLQDFRTEFQASSLSILGTRQKLFAEVSLCGGLCFISSVARGKGTSFVFPVPFLDAMKAIGDLPSGGCKMRRQRDWEMGPFLAPESIMKCLHD